MKIVKLFERAKSSRYCSLLFLCVVFSCLSHAHAHHTCAYTQCLMKKQNEVLLEKTTEIQTAIDNAIKTQSEEIETIRRQYQQTYSTAQGLDLIKQKCVQF